ncbi:MAG: FAD-dependent oxidoreductase [Bacteroidota bacterium]
MVYSTSFWENETYLKKVDYAIIGSGIVGLNAALQLKILDTKAQVLLIDRAAIPQGASTKNAGFACFGSPTELLDDLRSHSRMEVWDLVQERWEGLQKLRTKLGDRSLDYCHYGGYELFRATEKGTFEDCLAHLEEMNQAFEQISGEKNVFQVQDAKIRAFGFQGVQHLIASKIEGQLHPAKMVEALQQLCGAANVSCLYGLATEQVENRANEVVIHCRNGWKLKARKVLIATNGFAKSLLPKLNLLPARNQVLVTKSIPNLAFKGCFHYDRGYFYFRNIGNRVLLGGGRNLALKVEQSDQFGQTDLIQKALIDLLENLILPKQYFEIEQWWSGILGIGVQKKPIVKMVDDRIGVAVRLGGMGVAIGTSVGERAAKMLAIG